MENTVSVLPPPQAEMLTLFIKYSHRKHILKTAEKLLFLPYTPATGGGIFESVRGVNLLQPRNFGDNDKSSDK